KGFQFLIRGLKDLQHEYENLKLVIIGTGPYKKNLEQLIQKYNLLDKVEIHEKVPRQKLVNYYVNCTLFALMSKGESSGISVLEALIARKPVLVTQTYALKNYVEKGLAIGVSYPPSQDDIHENISLILQNPKLYIPNSFRIPTWDVVVERLDTLYKSILYAQ
ncbi:MAG: glycosyltransferase, partial [Candidatus Hodarchaeota archaeon]